MIYVWIIGLSLLVTAIFSAAEMSFIAANRVRLRHMAEGGNRTAVRYLDAFRSPERLLSTAMMGVTIAHITASSVATWVLLPVVGGAAAILVTLALTPIMLVFGEVIPKAVARERATGFTGAYSGSPWAAAGEPASASRRAAATAQPRGPRLMTGGRAVEWVHTPGSLVWSDGSDRRTPEDSPSRSPAPAP